MDEDRTTKKVFNAQPIGSWERGRQNLRWIDENLLVPRTENCKTLAGRRLVWKRLLEKAKPIRKKVSINKYLFCEIELGTKCVVEVDQHQTILHNPNSRNSYLVLPTSFHWDLLLIVDLMPFLTPTMKSGKKKT
ncbi:hypothetical protein TNCV_2954561 [Trichonephila clavipes]|nr:hypothetical protein TNCV_2954561 [Trichonephila clavipes]